MRAPMEWVVGTYASWVQQALYESYYEVRAQQQRATHRQKRNYEGSGAHIPHWMLDTSVLPPSQKEQVMFTMDRTI